MPTSGNFQTEAYLKTGGSTYTVKKSSTDALNFNAALIVEKLNSVSLYPPDVLEPSCPQETNGKLMQHSCYATQIGQKIYQILVGSTEPDKVLYTIAAALREAFQVEACWIVTSCDRKVEPQPIFADVIEEQNLQPLRAVLKISTLFQGQQNGLIAIGRSLPHVWTDEEKELLQVVSEPVAIAIGQFQLQQQLHRAIQHQTSIDRLTMVTRSTSDLNEIFDCALVQAASNLQVDRGAILLLKYTDPLFKYHSSEQLPKAKISVNCERLTSEEGAEVLPARSPNHAILERSFWLSDCQWCQQAFTQAPAPLALSDRTQLPQADVTTDSLTYILDSAAMPALLLVPLMGNKTDNRAMSTVLGFLVFQHSQARTWLPEELNLLNWVSAQVSAAIIQNQTLRQVQALVQERTAQLQSSLDVQAKLYEKTRQQIDQLRHLNQLKDEFLSTVSHELRTPLTNMVLAIRMLRQLELSSERRIKYLDILETQCNQEINLVNDLLDLQQLESSRKVISWQDIDLKAVLRDLTGSFEQKWNSKALRLVVDLPEGSLSIQSDGDSLNRILVELLNNAGKFSHPETTVHLQVTYQAKQQPAQVVLSISNTGYGISKREQTYIFDKFRRGEGITKQAIQGTGLGLALVKRLVEHLNGTIEIKSEPIEALSENSAAIPPAYQTCFALVLPQFGNPAEYEYS